MRRPWLAAWTLLVAATAAGAAGGDAPFEFVKLDAGARPAGLAGAFTAVADDANAVWYNPAGLAARRDSEASFMHTQHFQGVRQEYLAAALKPGLGAAVNYLDYGELQRTTLSDPGGTGLGTFGAQDLAVVVGYGRGVLDGLAAGGALRYLRGRIDDQTADAAAVDAGLLWKPEAAKGLSLGAALQNLGTKAKYQGTAEALPLLLRTGLAWRGWEGRFLAAADVVDELHAGASLSLGLEARMDPAALRLGYTTRNDAGAGVTVGGGLNWTRFSFDYAFVPFGDLGDSHRFSVSARF